MEEEPRELEIELEPENIYISPVKSVNGKTGDVVLKTSDLENDSGYQNATEVSNTVNNAVGVHNQSSSAHQDIRQLITDEATTRSNADNNLQGQIDAITSSSDVVDIVGTYAELQAYDTQHLQDNDVIKVLQDETHNDAMTYWRWDKQTETWTYIGAEGPYYTKSETNDLLDEKLDVDEVPDGFFDGPATVSDEGTSLALSGAIKFKDVKILGNSDQQTYTGKNLIYTQNGTHTSAGVTWTITEDTIIGSGQATSSPSNITDGNSYFVVPLPAGTYTFSLQEPAPHRIGVYLMSEGGTGYNVVAIQAGETKATFTTNYTAVYFRITCGNLTVGEQLNLTYINKLQLEVGDQATDYEPYVGSVPAPNPDYPQDVNVVTGEQTITITNGDDVQNVYTIDLGSIELVKIGDYQDYIYKSGDDWYVHKAIGKYTFTGTENWSASSYGTNSWYRITFTNLNYDAGSVIVLCDLAQGVSYDDGSRYDNPPVSICYGTSNGTFWLRNTAFATLADLQAATNGKNVYYWMTPTDTKITGIGLIAQLNNLFNATLYQPTTTITSSGDLPAILNVEAFTDNLNSLIEIASNPDDNVFVGTDGVNAGVSGLVPAPASTDVDKFLKSDGTWDTAGGGSTINVVQTTGDSQTDVMSQNATTGMIYSDTSASVPKQIRIGGGGGAVSNYAIRIGHSGSAGSNNVVSIGYNSTATSANAVALGSEASAAYRGSVALGSSAQTTVKGQIMVGTNNTYDGYNSTNYRIISGVHDGQSANDAVTVNQVNSLIDNLNSALNTNIPHIGA